VLYSASLSCLDYCLYSLILFLVLLSMANKDSFIMLTVWGVPPLGGVKQWWGGKQAIFSKTAGDRPTSKVTALCSEKNTHSHFLSWSSSWIICVIKNCSEYTKGLTDSDNVKMRYSLRSVTYLWRHICLAKVGASLQHAVSRDPKDLSFSFLCEYRVLSGA